MDTEPYRSWIMNHTDKDTYQRLAMLGPPSNTSTQQYYLKNKAIQKAKGLPKNTVNKSLGNMILPEHKYPTTANPGYPNTTKEQGNDLKSNL